MLVIYPMSLFSGLAVATITPFSNGEIDFNAYKKYLLYLKDKGIRSYVINGSTGEPHSLKLKERLSLLEFARKTLPDCHIIGGICSNNTYNAIEESEYAASLKADSLLVITPFCSKCTDKGLYQHFKEIKEHSSLDLIAYNIPSRTGVELDIRHVEFLAKEGIIQGIKQGDANIKNTAKFSIFTEIFSGDDGSIAYTKPFNQRGAISVLANVYPEAVQALLSLPLKDTISLQQKLSPFITALFAEVNPVMIKYLLSKLNLIKDELRLPLTEGKNVNKQNLLAEAFLVGLPDLQA